MDFPSFGIEFGIVWLLFCMILLWHTFNLFFIRWFEKQIFVLVLHVFVVVCAAFVFRSLLIVSFALSMPIC